MSNWKNVLKEYVKPSPTKGGSSVEMDVSMFVSHIRNLRKKLGSKITPMHNQLLDMYLYELTMGYSGDEDDGPPVNPQFPPPKKQKSSMDKAFLVRQIESIMKKYSKDLRGDMVE
jgi:hypothetical protein